MLNNILHRNELQKKDGVFYTLITCAEPVLNTYQE